LQGLQFLPQPQPGGVEAGHDGASGNVQDRRQLLVAEIMEIPQHEDLPMGHRELRQTSPHGFPQLAALQIRRRIRPGSTN